MYVAFFVGGRGREIVSLRRGVTLLVLLVSDMFFFSYFTEITDIRTDQVQLKFCSKNLIHFIIILATHNSKLLSSLRMVVVFIIP